MNYEKIEALIVEAEAETKRAKFLEAERLCHLALEKFPHSTAQEMDKSLARTQTERGDDYKIMTTLRARVFTGLSESFWRRGIVKEALPYAEEAVRLSVQAENKGQEAMALNTLGVVNRMLANYPRALEYFSKALRIAEEMGNEYGVASTTGNIGLVYKALSDYPRALEYLSKGLTVSEKIGDTKGIIRNTGSIGNVYMDILDYPRALEFYSKALALSEEMEDKNGVAGYTGNIGIVYKELSDYPRALEYFSKALAMFEEVGNKSAIADSTGNIGSIYALKEFEGYDAQIAEDYMLKTKALFAELGWKKFEVDRALAYLYKSVGRWEDALKHYEQYHEQEKEVLSEEATKQAQLMENRRKVEEAERDRQVKLARFQEQEKILLNILPAQIAERILEGEKRIANLHEHVSVFFSDIVGFTKLSQTVTPDELLTMLNEIFSEFDRIARKHGLEKIKTIGDAYMAVAGVPIAQEDHAERAAAFSIDVIEYMKDYRKISKSDLQIRVGLHCGKAIAGVIGENKFAYDLWGDSVNTASRMESHGEAGKIHVSEDFRNALKESSFQFVDRGEMDVKGKEKMKTYFLEL